MFAGALVRTASGGPVLVVQAIGEGGLGIGTCARTCWFERGQFEIAEIPLADLVSANSKTHASPSQSHTVGPSKHWLSRSWRAHENKLKIIGAGLPIERLWSLRLQHVRTDPKPQSS